jgi:hypothetical protein
MIPCTLLTRAPYDFALGLWQFPVPLSLSWLPHTHMPGQSRLVSQREFLHSHTSGPMSFRSSSLGLSSQFRCHLLNNAFFHLSSQKGALTWRGISTSPKDMPPARGPWWTFMV